MNEINMDQYSDLAGTGYSRTEPVPPEQEFFHSIYISGQNRKNHINIEEQVGLFQVRGVEYNLTQVNMIITNVKEILVKAQRINNKEKIECFCYKTTQPWTGTSGRVCGMNSAERAANEFCNICRAQIVVSGIYCDTSGKPLIDKDNKPVFVFLRGKGMKYSNVSNYLGDMYKKDLPPIFSPATEESTKFEKEVVNKMRFVTTITKGDAKSQYGMQKIFELNSGVQLDNKVVKSVLDITKKTVDKFNEKFDWSKNKMQAATSGYGDQPQTPVYGILDAVPGEGDAKKSPTEGGSFMSFDQVEF